MKKIGIIGRTNVGKSTLFNRLIKQNKSIISPIAGTTRDFVSGRVMMGNEEVEIIDFGGFDFDVNEVIGKNVQEKIYKNINGLDLIILVLDGQCGISAEDEVITEKVRKLRKPVIVAINKIDSIRREDDIYEFYKLGFEIVIGISAANNKNIENLVLEITKKLKLKKKKSALVIKKDLTKITIIGKPNVGKSSLFNQLCGEERSIVTEIAGTTRDTIDVEVALGKKTYLFVDTAGLRRKTKINEYLDRESSYKSIRAINNADIIIYVLDANQYTTAYDINLLEYALKKGRPILVVVNKWDIKPADMTETKYKNTVTNDNSIFKGLSFVFTSAVKRRGIDDLIEEIKQIEIKLDFKIKTSVLNQELKKIVYEMGGMKQKVFYATQVGTRPIEILLFINNKKFFTKKHTAFIEKKLREKYQLSGIPIFIKLRERDRL